VFGKDLLQATELPACLVIERPAGGLADLGRLQDAEVLQDRLGDDRVPPPSAEDDQGENLRVQAIRLLFLALPVALVDADEGPDEHRARHATRGAAPEVIHQGDPPQSLEDGHSLAERPFDLGDLPVAGRRRCLLFDILDSGVGADNSRQGVHGDDTALTAGEGEILHHDRKIRRVRDCQIVVESLRLHRLHPLGGRRLRKHGVCPYVAGDRGGLGRRPCVRPAHADHQRCFARDLPHGAFGDRLVLLRVELLHLAGNPEDGQPVGFPGEGMLDQPVQALQVKTAILLEGSWEYRDDAAEARVRVVCG
jgi:hypothetical protein